MHDRLAGERLERHQREHCHVDECRDDDEEQPHVIGGEQAPPPPEPAQEDGEQRQQLQRVHPDEMRDAQVAPDSAPAEQREAGSAIRQSNRVCTGDPLEVRQLLRGRTRHQVGESHADECDDGARAHSEGGRGRRQLQEEHGDGREERADVERRDGDGHDRPDRRRERSADIEVTRRSGRSGSDDRELLDEQGYGDDRSDSVGEPAPAGQVSDQPGPGDAVEKDRD